jgi:hypothetical protein
MESSLDGRVPAAAALALAATSRKVKKLFIFVVLRIQNSEPKLSADTR